jgi:hypothetical protein
MRRTSAVVVTVLGLLLLSGCFKVDADFTVNADETVDGTMIVAVEEEFLDMMGELGGEGEGTEELVNPEDLPEGTEVEEYDEGGYVGQKVTFEGVTLEEMTSSMDEGEAATDEWSLTHEGDEFVFDGTMDMTTGEDEMDMSGMMEGAELSISMTFPGDVTESNGEIEGNTVTWEPQVGELNEMRAVAADEAGFPVALVAGIVVAVLLLAALGAFIVLGGRRTAQAAPAAATDPRQPDAAQPPAGDLDPRT